MAERFPIYCVERLYGADGTTSAVVDARYAIGETGIGFVPDGEVLREQGLHYPKSTGWRSDRKEAVRLALEQQRRSVLVKEASLKGARDDLAAYERLAEQEGVS